jgi:hypothetical protein
MGTRALSVGIKRPGREADYSPPSSAEVKNEWSYTSTPQYVFVAWCLVKHTDNFTFFLLYSKTNIKIGFPLSIKSPKCFCLRLTDADKDSRYVSSDVLCLFNDYISTASVI